MASGVTNRVACVAAAVWLTALGGCAQLETGMPAPSMATQDALRYQIELDVDLDAERLQGSVRYVFRADAPLDSIVLDARRSETWRVEFVDDTGSELAARWSDEHVVISLGRRVAAGAELSFVGRFEGSPPDGFYFGQSRYGQPLAFTDHYSIRAHGWLPCEDHPADRAQFGVVVSFPEGNRAVASGARAQAEYDPRPGRLIVATETRSEIPPYMLAIGVGPYAEVVEKGDDRLRPHLIYPQDVEKARPFLVHHAAWLRLMENAFGPYAYGKYMVFQCPTRWGGFEAPGNVQISENLFDNEGACVRVLAHELVHMWFGDAVGYSEWRDVWLSEGFASYFGPWLQAQTGGPTLAQSMLGMRQSWRRSPQARRWSIRRADFPHPDQALNANTYQKGAWVLHMLRLEVGDEAFFKALRGYFERFHGSSVLTGDFVAVVQESTGGDLGWFFEQWLERVDCPALGFAVDGDRLVVEQTQPGPPYRLRLPVGLTAADGAAVKVYFETREQRSEFVLPAGARDPVIDPDVELLYRERR